ncbi:MAG: PASTA domain-containing protein [Solirubrobacteraceae bacterium]
MRWGLARGLIALLTLLLALVPTAAAARFFHVPHLRGETVAKAERTIRRAHLKVGRVTYAVSDAAKPGHVVRTRPTAGTRVRRGSKVAITAARMKRRTTASPGVGPVQALPPPALPIVGVANVPGCLAGADPTPYIQMYGAQIMRLVVSPSHGADGEAVPCVRAAIADGIKVHLTIQYWNSWTIAEQVAFFRQVLSYYGPQVWAVSVGNEQELWIHGPPQTAAEYGSTWRAVVPVIRSAAPQALLVAGEISPWGEAFLKAALADGLPGAQAVAAHAYQAWFSFSIPELEAWSAEERLPLWFTEGLTGPDVWESWWDLTLEQLAGAAVADAWLAS